MEPLKKNWNFPLNLLISCFQVDKIDFSCFRHSPLSSVVVHIAMSQKAPAKLVGNDFFILLGWIIEQDESEWSRRRKRKLGKRATEIDMIIYRHHHHRHRWLWHHDLFCSTRCFLLGCSHFLVDRARSGWDAGKIENFKFHGEARSWDELTSWIMRLSKKNA